MPFQQAMPAPKLPPQAINTIQTVAAPVQPAPVAPVMGQPLPDPMAGLASPGQIDNQRGIAEMLLASSQEPVTSVWGGLGGIAEALAGGDLAKKAGEKESAVLEADRSSKAASAQREGQVISMLLMGQEPDPALLSAVMGDPNAANRGSIIELLKPKPPGEGFSLSPGEIRYDAAGNEIAGVPAAKPEPPTSVQEFQFAQQNGYTGSYEQFKKDNSPGTNVTVNTGDNGVQYPAPPSDFDYGRNEDGTIKLIPDPGGSGSSVPFLVPLPGSKTAEERTASGQQADTRQATKEMKGDIVLDDIDRTLAEVEANPDATTGIGGWLMGNLPVPSPANRVNGFLNGIKSNLAIDNLTQMRMESPTGGALGNVTEGELAILTGVYGDLAQSTDPATFTYNMKRLRNAYLDIIHGKGKGPPRLEIQPPGPMNAPDQQGQTEDIPVGTVIINDQTGERMRLTPQGWQKLGATPTPAQRNEATDALRQGLQ